MAEELFNPSELMAVLRDLANDVREGYKETLERNGRKATGDLINSIHTEIEVNGTRYIVWMEWDDPGGDYWKYVEEDTKPHWPPRDAILKWIRVKPIIPRPDANGRIPKPEQLAFLISRAMAGKSPNQANCKSPKGGTIGSHDLRKSEDAVLAFYQERLTEALHRDCLNYLEKVMP